MWDKSRNDRNRDIHTNPKAKSAFEIKATTASSLDRSDKDNREIPKTANTLAINAPIIAGNPKKWAATSPGNALCVIA
jgi:hypothetical protein